MATCPGHAQGFTYLFEAEQAFLLTTSYKLLANYLGTILLKTKQMNCLSRLTVANLKLVALLDVKHNRSDSSYLPRELMNRGSSLLFLFHR